jgi:hypothetical protein
MPSVKENANLDLVLGPGELCSNSKLLLLGVGIVGFFGVLLYAAGYDEKYRMHGIEGGLGLVVIAILGYIYFLNIFGVMTVSENCIRYEKRIFGKPIIYNYKISDLEEVCFSVLGDLLLNFKDHRSIRISKMLVRLDGIHSDNALVDLKNVLEGKMSIGPEE